MSLAGFLNTIANVSPVQYAAGTGRPLWTSGGTSKTTQLEAMGQNGTLTGIVNRLANDTAQCNWRIYRKAASGKKEDRIETKHAALDLWNKPNPFMTRQEFVEGMEQHIELAGESEWCVVRSGSLAVGLPLELWYVRPDKIAPVPHPEEFLAGWVYTNPDGTKIPLERDEVIQLRIPNPTDPYRGLSVVQTVMSDLDSTKFAAEWNRNFFRNSAQPGGLIKVDRTLSDREFNNLRDRWNDSHRGLNRAHRVGILEMADYQTVGFSQKDMQFTELRMASRDTVMEAFTISKPMMGITDDVNLANATAGEIIYARKLLVGRLERIKGALNNDLLPMFGKGQSEMYEFDYDSPVPEDETAEQQAFASLVDAAVKLITTGFSPEDTLRVLGLPEIEWKGKEVPASAGPIAPQPTLPEDNPADSQAA